MAELKIKIPELLKEESIKIEREMREIVSLQEKRKLLSLFMDEIMKNAKQLSNAELIKLGRELKKGRFRKLRQAGTV